MGLLDGKKIACVFPGQGSQAVGMGKNLAESRESVKSLFAAADGILGFSISELCFNGPEDQLSQTLNTQPALYTTSCAAYTALSERGIQPAFTSGHSVGEYAALFAAGAFTFDEGLKLVRQRAELMQKAAERNPGAMAAILGLSPRQVEEVVTKASDAGVVGAANFNSPIQTVISGEASAVKRASEIASEMGAKRVVPLKVSGAFHSPLMADAANALLDALKASEITDPRVPVVANFTADFETTADEVRANLANQVTGSVRWVESITKLLDGGVEVFLELGPGNVLAGLIKRIASGVEVYCVGDTAALDALA